MTRSPEATLFDDAVTDDGPPMTRIERFLRGRGVTRIAGVDEAGRGCLAGPVVAAAVILPEGVDLDGVTDSKQVPRHERESMAAAIRSRAEAVAIGLCNPPEIDDLNILWAAMEAMRRALQRLETSPEYVLIDGNTMIPDCEWPAKAVVKGDSRSLSIAAASIIAKTHRDQLMRRLHEQYPEYGWDSNVGYPTEAHYAALRTHGPTPHHRRSFRLA